MTPIRISRVAELATVLRRTDQVILVPGYGLGLAQAQRPLTELVSRLTEREVDVRCAIHPVAGRFPGHLNHLLADLPDELLIELDEANAAFPTCDLVLVVGADDVINPAARDDPTSPIYGMPILDVTLAAHVMIMKRTTDPGFAGVENASLRAPNVQLIFGDLAATLPDLLRRLASMPRGGQT